MLIQLSIRNLAVVEDITINFESGMTSLTGETGAGKSILIDALGLVLGDRADSNMVRNDCERAEIAASFDTEQNPALSNWLAEHELDEEGQCQLRRTISKEGRSKAYINGRSVALAQLREVSRHSIDIHGQHAHQSLIRTETQRGILDSIAGTQSLLSQLKNSYQQLKNTQLQLQNIQQQSSDQQAQKALLEYQINELATLNISVEQIEQLIQTQQQLSHSVELINAVQSVQHSLFEQEQGAAYSQLNEALNQVQHFVEIEPKFASLIEHIQSSVILLDEASTECRHYLDQIDSDPEQLTQVETELSQLHDQARKHQIEIEALPAHFAQLQQQLSALTNIEQDTAQLQQAELEQTQFCIKLCQQITAKRQQAAKQLSQNITESIQKLAIPTGEVEFVVSPKPNNEFNEMGADSVTILVRTNPGQAKGELSKVASGGELARISLAIQVVTAGHRNVPTMIFDEVDVGIGGGVAEIVGQHLRKLARNRQVISITHLPQVAAQAQHQLQVNKKNLATSVHIDVTKLDQNQRIEEIARMLGGVTITETTRRHAEEMLSGDALS